MRRERCEEGKGRLKRLFLAVIIAALAIMTAACGSSGSGESESSSGTDSNVLVVYFSATGNTERVAEYIADEADADLFEVVPADPYTDDDLNYNDENSRVSREHEDESLQDVELQSTDVPDWDSYDTVFVGYPIWWGGAAWPINGFVKANDFSGKKVIPFCTSSSSDIGTSGTDLAEMAGTGDWQDGQRFSSGASEDEVDEWVDSLNL